MIIRLLADLIKSWWNIRQLTHQMYKELPQQFQKDWPALPWKRYQVFYGVLVPVIIHDALFRLHGTTPSIQLNKVASAQALITGPLDDLFDQWNLPAERIKELMNDPDRIVPCNHVEEYLCQYLYREIHRHFTGNQKRLEECVTAIVTAQEISNRQQSFTGQLMPVTDQAIEDILNITRAKGAMAVLFYRSCIGLPLTEAEYTLLSDLGCLFQMTNDINDALKDQNEGEHTLMTMGLTLREIQTIFENQLTQCNESRKNMPEGNFHKKGHFNRINILVARSLVTLDRYSRLTDPELPFHIQDILRHQILSGLTIPYEVRKWYRCYQRKGFFR